MDQDEEPRRVWRREDAKYVILLVTLVAMFVLSPLLQGQLLGVRLLDVFLVTVFCAAVFAVSRRRSTLFVGIILAAAVLATTVPQKFIVVHPAVMTASIVFVALFLAFVAVVILCDVLGGSCVSAGKICGAICVYLMLALLWGVLFAGMQRANPDSFRIEYAVDADVRPAGSTDDGALVRPRELAELNYFSFVTLTTLGYGDIVPRTRMARMLAQLEAVTGQLYLAVLVARLVALHIVHSSRELQDKGEHET
jgi:hypothetical protein